MCRYKLFLRCIGNTYNAGIQLANPKWSERGIFLADEKEKSHPSKSDKSAEQDAAEIVFLDLWYAEMYIIWLWNGVRCQEYGGIRVVFDMMFS
jgi:hypothetical protein